MGRHVILKTVETFAVYLKELRHVPTPREKYVSNLLQSLS